MPRKKAKEAEASIEETQPVEEETPEVKETPEVPVEEAPTEEIPTEEVATEEALEEAPKAEIKAPVIPQGVPVSSLAFGAQFEHKGKLYQKRESTVTIISGLDLEKTERTQQMVWKGFPSDTLVIPK